MKGEARCEHVSTWRKKFKGENGIRPPKALGQHRKAMTFATAVFSNHLKTADMNEYFLKTDNNEKFKPVIHVP